MQSDYEFGSKDGGKTWTRRCFGIEQLIGVMASKTPGFGMLTGGYVLSFPRQVSASALRAPLEAAWIRLRAEAPVIAYKTKDAKKDENSNPTYTLYYEYEVPNNTEAVRAWATETIKWHEDKMTLRERDIVLKNLWWRAPDGKYGYQLHVAPDVDENKWQILIHSAHWSADVRGSLQLSELLFTYLSGYLVHGVEPNLEIEWGKETKKLTPPMAIVGAQAAGMPVDMLFPKPPAAEPAPASAQETNQPEPEAQRDNSERVQPVKENGAEEKTPQQENGAPPAQAGPILFLRPAPVLDESPKHDAVATDVWLTREETAQFRAACKRHGITVTQAITALKVVAEVEWTLTYSEGRNDEQQKQTVEIYEKATHIPSMWNVIDQRRKLKEYSRHDSSKGSPPVAAEGFPLMIDMVTVRQAVKYNKDTGKVERDTSEQTFWGIVAKHAQDLWNASDSDLPACLEREMMGHMYSTMYDPTGYMIPALMASSVGDVEALGLLTAFSPSIPNPNSQDRLLLEQVSYSVRCPTPTKMVLSWQWDGRLLIRPQTASRWTSQKGIEKMGEVLREWIEATCLKD